MASSVSSLTKPSPAQPLLTSLTFSLYIAWFWFMSTLGGAVFLLSTYIQPGGVRLSFSRAIFHAVSASTLSGFPNTLSINDFLLPGQIALLALNVIGTFCAMSLGALALKHVLGLSASNVKLIALSLGLVVVALIPGAVVFRTLAGTLSSSAAFANSALQIGVIPPPTSSYLHLFLLPLSLAGGLGLPILMDLFRRVTTKHHRLSAFSLLTLTGWAAMFLTLLAFFLLTRPDSLGIASVAGGAAMSQSVVGGYGLAVESLSGFSRSASAWVTFAAILGIAPGGTTAGISLTTLAVLLVYVVRVLRGKGTKGIEPAVIAVALLQILSVLVLAVVTYGSLLATESQLATDRLLLISVSAASASALTHDPLTIVGPGLLILSLSLMVARAIPLVLLWVLAFSAVSQDKNSAHD